MQPAAINTSQTLNSVWPMRIHKTRREVARKLEDFDRALHLKRKDQAGAHHFAKASITTFPRQNWRAAPVARAGRTQHPCSVVGERTAAQALGQVAEPKHPDFAFLLA